GRGRRFEASARLRPDPPGRPCLGYATQPELAPRRDRRRLPDPAGEAEAGGSHDGSGRVPRTRERVCVADLCDVPGCTAPARRRTNGIPPRTIPRSPPAAARL